MTAPATSAGRRSARHHWTGPLWLAAYCLIVAAPMIAILIDRTPVGVAFWWDLSMGLGLAGLSMMGIQFALTARLRTVTAPFGADLVYVFHRYLALVGFAVLAAHFGVLYVFYSEALGSLDPRVAAWELTAGRVALVAFGLAVVTAEFRKPLRLEYGLWRYLHVALAMTGLVAAIAHVIGTGRLAQTPTSLVVWGGLVALWFGVVVWLRLLKPWSLARRPYRIVEVRPERGEAWTVVLEPDGQPAVGDFSPGQFAWLSLASTPYALRDHPFSISSSPDRLPRLEMTIKALGDFSGAIKDLPVGRRAWIDGPFGVFSFDRYPDATGLIFVAGGIGITPVMSMLRSLAERGDRRPLWLFYANPDWEAVTFCEELQTLETRLDLRIVHVIEEPPADFQGEAGLLDEAILRRHLPDLEAQDFRCFLCGPVPLTDTAEDALRAMGLPASHIRTELFELA